MTGLAQQRLGMVSTRVNDLSAVESRLAQAESDVGNVKGQIDKLLGLGAKRAQWPDVLDQIHACLPEGMWLTSIAPVAPAAPAADNPQMPPPVPGQAPEAAGIRSIEIAGLGYRDKVTSGSPIRDFRDKLRASPAFGPETDIIWQPAPGADDAVIQYKISVVLKKPLDV
jgi:Tfp pilus assembly protein PilN